MSVKKPMASPWLKNCKIMEHTAPDPARNGASRPCLETGIQSPHGARGNAYNHSGGPPPNS
eukprot:11215391-Lingulodinium_polyedra.AAC.1